MNPLALGLLLQGGGGLLSGLFGAGQSRKAQKRAREFRAKMMQIADPAYLRALQTSLYNNALAGPAFGQARRNIFNAGTNITNRLQGSLAARGLSNSGVGALAPALAGSSMAGQLGQARTSLFNAAGTQAGEQQDRLLRALQGMGEEPSYNYGSQAIGGAFGDIGKYLLDYSNSQKKK